MSVMSTMRHTMPANIYVYVAKKEPKQLVIPEAVQLVLRKHTLATTISKIKTSDRVMKSEPISNSVHGDGIYIEPCAK
eukprot:2174631-Rhodomonas_salina.1